MNAIFIKKIHIKKVRHLHNIEIELDKKNRKHLILTGKNGSGKTSTLNTLKTHLSFIEKLNTYTEKFDKTIAEMNKEARFKNKLSTTTHNDIINKKDIKKKIKIYRTEASKELETTFDGENASILFKDNNFILASFNAKRQTNIQQPPGPKKLDLPKKNGFSSEISSYFMQYLVNLRTEKSYANDDNDTKKVAEITAWFNRFQNYLKRIFNDETLELIFDRKNFTFNFKTQGKESFSFNTLSDGYSAILNIIVDLILRMESSHSKNYDMQGIVLIDELETHLHIDLQKQALPFLCEFFPNIQFIITTHSPFILNSISNAVIYDLEKNIRLEDASAYAYDGLIEGYFYNDKYSTQIKNELAHYKLLTKQATRTEDEEDEMIDLRLKLKFVPAHLAMELVTDFKTFEVERKAAIQL